MQVFCRGSGRNAALNAETISFTGAVRAEVHFECWCRNSNEFWTLHTHPDTLTTTADLDRTVSQHRVHSIRASGRKLADLTVLVTTGHFKPKAKSLKCHCLCCAASGRTSQYSSTLIGGQGCKDLKSCYNLHRPIQPSIARAIHCTATCISGRTQVHVHCMITALWVH